MTKGSRPKYSPGVRCCYLSLGKQFKIFMQLAITFPELNYAVNKPHKSNLTNVRNKHKVRIKISVVRTSEWRVVSNTFKAAWAAIIQLAKLT